MSDAKKHTPGPWETCGNLVRTARRPSDMSGVLVAECPLTNDRRAEDACLISAAPDMLQALQDAKNSLVAFKFMPGERNAWEDHDEANLAAVNAALAKARGEAC